MNLIGETSGTPRVSESTTALLLCMAAALLVIAPALLHGFPAGHDTGLHAPAWFDIAQHWREGTIIPSWGARYAYGLGEPTFILYTPLSMWLGALLLTLFGPALAPTFFLFVTSTIGGFGVYKFCRIFFSQWQSIVGACFYAAAPYLALSAYERNAFAEILAASVFPFAAYYLQRTIRRESGFLGLVASLTIIGISDVPAAVVAGTALLILAVVDSIQQRSLRSFALFCVASAIAALWAAFYILPASIARHLVQIDEAVRYYKDPRNGFVLLARQFHFIAGDFISALQVISVVEMVFCFAAFVVVFFALRRGRPVAMLLPVAIMASVCSLMMFPMANVLYRHVPVLTFAVPAWRFLFVLSFASAVFVCAGLEHRETRAFAVIGAALLLVGWFALWPPSHYRDPDATWNSSFNQRTATIGPYFDHMPLTVPPKDFQRFATFPIVTMLSDRPDPATAVQVTQWNTELRRIRFNSPQPTTLLVRLIYFPGWQAEIDGRPAPIQADPASGFIRVNVHGSGELVLRYRWTPARKLGWTISLLAICATLACAQWFSRTQQSGNPKAAAV